MPDRTTPSTRSAVVVRQMTDRMTTLARTLSAWVQADTYPLQAIEAQVVHVLRDLGTSRLAALLPLAAPVRPEPDVPCDCGQQARYVRVRPATVATVLGRITIERAIDQCQHCGTSRAPLDRRMQIAAGRPQPGAAGAPRAAGCDAGPVCAGCQRARTAVPGAGLPQSCARGDGGSRCGAHRTCAGGGHNDPHHAICGAGRPTPGVP